jgi:hypothetical protein
MEATGMFRVYPMWHEDVFKDIVRLPEQARGGIREGSICTVSVNGHTRQLVVRGLEEALSGGIMLDEITRKTMGDLQEGMSYNFSIKEAGIFGHLRWACCVSDRGYRISAWVGIISLGLGLLGAALGGLSLYIALR